MSAERHVFLDPIAGIERLLVITPGEGRPYDGRHGVEHAGCERLADVHPELDAFSCTACHVRGRISGAWFMDLWTSEAAR